MLDPKRWLGPLATVVTPPARSAPRSTTRAPLHDAPPVAWRDGVQLAGSVVWCDAARARDLTFVSHAHVGCRPAHRKVLTTERTLALLQALSPDGAGRGTRAGEVLVSPFGRPFSLGGLRLELFPSGHVPGAASLLVVDADGRRVIYGGDVNSARSLGEGAEVRGADVLVLEAPLATRHTLLPPRAELHALLVEKVRRAMEAGKRPVVLAPPLGVAQEAARVLGEAGVALRAHRRIHAVCQAYAPLGLALPAVARYSGRVAAGEALLWPLEPRRAPPPLVENRHIIALSGLALEPALLPALAADEALPLCDHADLAALVRYVRDTGARDVYLTFGHGEPLSSALAPLGVRAFPLGPPRQMELFA